MLITDTFILGYIYALDLPTNIRAEVTDFFNTNDQSEAGYPSIVVGNFADLDLPDGEAGEYLKTLFKEAQDRQIGEVLFLPGNSPKT